MIFWTKGAYKLNKICPGITIRAAKPKGGVSPSIVELLPSPTTANLSKIECNVPEAVLLRLLTCKDENQTKMPEECPYPEHKNIGAEKLACNLHDIKLAQVYIKKEKSTGKSRSCLIVFIEGQYLNKKINELLERLKNSVAWLDIEKEKPYFYIFYFGQPVFLLTANDSCRRINRRIKELFLGYSQDEDVCIMAPVQRNSSSLIINHFKIFH
jgi:hypothetical protein